MLSHMLKITMLESHPGLDFGPGPIKSRLLYPRLSVSILLGYLSPEPPFFPLFIRLGNYFHGNLHNATPVRPALKGVWLRK